MRRSLVPVQKKGSGKEAQIMYSLDEVKREDPEIAEAIEQEMQRQNDHIELIASENWVSKAVMAAMGSPLTNTRKDIPDTAITAAASAWTSWKRLPLNARRNCLAVNMPMFSRIPARRQTSR